MAVVSSTTTKPAPPAPLETQGSWLEGARLSRFEELCARHSISPLFASKLRSLEAFDIVLVLDDSSAMAARLHPSAASTSALTRWDELRATVQLLVDLAATVDKDGVDLFFLNRPPAMRVAHASAVEDAFAPPPSGHAPIASTLERVMQVKGAGHVEGKRLLIVILSAGEPTDEDGRTDIVRLSAVLDARPPTVWTSFVACTDDRDVLAYLNTWDRVKPRLDVTDDYASERAEVLQAQGVSFPFSRGDYLVKLLLGAVDPDIDALDQKPTKDTARGAACCALM